MTNSSRKVVLITGASSGLGRAIATELHQRGHRVFGTSRNPQAHAAPWPMLALDVCSDASVRACVDAVLAEAQRIDVLVNNAGHALIAALEETSLEQARAQMETNYFGALRMMLAVLPAMRARNAGHLINMSSVSGALGLPFAAAYGASKHALEGVSEALAHELHGTPIRVTLIEPDGMRTGIALQGPERDHPVLAARRRRLRARLDAVTAVDGPGNDPGVLARAVGDAIEVDAAPLRIAIGDLTHQLIAAKRQMTDRELAALIARLGDAP